jgi:tetratricopeptide (TPR) repeat protein
LGRKRTWAWKYIYLYTVSLIFLFLFLLSCATLKGNDPLLRSKMLLAKGDYESALKENKRILSRYPDRPPADEALFNIGLIYSHYGNPEKNYKKSFSFFWRLLKEFPQSSRAEEAKIWTGVLNTIEETKIKLGGQISAHKHLLQSQVLLVKGDYESALKENKRILSRYPDRLPGDEALFNIGLIYVYLKEYKNAFEYFGRLLKEFPQSSRAEEAKIWTGVLNTIEETKKVDIQIEEKKKELVR